MQFLKKFNLRTTGILTFAIYSLLTFIGSAFFNIYFYMLNNNTRPHRFDTIIFSYVILKTIIAPLIFIVFIFALYLLDFKKVNYIILKIFGIISVIFSISLLSFELLDYFHYIYFEALLYFLFLSLSELTIIGFILFVLTKFKKTFFSIYSFGLLCNLFCFILQLGNYIRYFSEVFSNYNAINNYYLIYILLISIFNFLFGIILWFYCYFEIKNKQKAINEEIITQSK